MNRTSTLTRTFIAAALAASTTAAQAVSFNISNDKGGWLASLTAMGPTTYGTGNFVGVGCDPGVACSGVAVNGLPGVSFAQVGGGSASYDNGLLNTLASGGYLEWLFTTPQNGWGGTFQMATDNGLAFQALDLPGGPGGNLGWIDVAGASVDAGQELNGFLGFTSTDQFGGVRVLGFADASSYKMTDVSVGAVPLPAAVWLFASALGLAGVGFHRRRQQA